MLYNFNQHNSLQNITVLIKNGDYLGLNNIYQRCNNSDYLSKEPRLFLINSYKNIPTITLKTYISSFEINFREERFLLAVRNIHLFNLPVI